MDRPPAAGADQQPPAPSAEPGDPRLEILDATLAELETWFKQERVRALERTLHEREAHAALQRDSAQQLEAAKAREADLRAQQEQALRDAGEVASREVRRLEVALERASVHSKMLARELETRWAVAKHDSGADAARPARGNGEREDDPPRRGGKAAEGGDAAVASSSESETPRPPRVDPSVGTPPGPRPSVIAGTIEQWEREVLRRLKERKQR